MSYQMMPCNHPFHVVIATILDDTQDEELNGTPFVNAYPVVAIDYNPDSSYREPYTDFVVNYNGHLAQFKDLEREYRHKEKSGVLFQMALVHESEIEETKRNLCDCVTVLRDVLHQRTIRLNQTED